MQGHAPFEDICSKNPHSCGSVILWSYDRNVAALRLIQPRSVIGDKTVFNTFAFLFSLVDLNPIFSRIVCGQIRVIYQPATA